MPAPCTVMNCAVLARPLGGQHPDVRSLLLPSDVNQTINAPQRAREFVGENFLLTRHPARYLALIHTLRGRQVEQLQVS